jgi:hypothetical protein
MEPLIVWTPGRRAFRATCGLLTLYELFSGLLRSTEINGHRISNVSGAHISGVTAYVETRPFIKSSESTVSHRSRRRINKYWLFAGSKVGFDPVSHLRESIRVEITLFREGLGVELLISISLLLCSIADRLTCNFCGFSYSWISGYAC